jgi:hypothetical protein
MNLTLTGKLRFSAQSRPLATDTPLPSEVFEPIGFV